MDLTELNKKFELFGIQQEYRAMQAELELIKKDTEFLISERDRLSAEFAGLSEPVNSMTMTRLIAAQEAVKLAESQLLLRAKSLEARKAEVEGRKSEI